MKEIKNYIYIQGIKRLAQCVSCDKNLTKKQIKDWEVNRFTFACGEEHWEENL